MYFDSSPSSSTRKREHDEDDMEVDDREGYKKIRRD